MIGSSMTNEEIIARLSANPGVKKVEFCPADNKFYVDKGLFTMVYKKKQFDGK